MWSSPFSNPSQHRECTRVGNGGLKKKKKKKLIARVGIHGHIYYMNKKRQFLNSLWPFCMIKINLALKNLVICYAMSIDFKRCQNTETARSQKTEQTMQKMMQKYRASTFTKNRANDAKKWRNSMAQPELGFLLGPITTFFSRSQWWASSRAQPIGSPLADRPTIQRCGAVLVIQGRGACTQPAHLIPSRRPDLRAVTWREGMIGWPTLGARVRQNPAGFWGVLSWSTGFQRLWLSITNLKKSKKYETFAVRRFIRQANEEKY